MRIRFNIPLYYTTPMVKETKPVIEVLKWCPNDSKFIYSKSVYLIKITWK